MSHKPAKNDISQVSSDTDLLALNKPSQSKTKKCVSSTLAIDAHIPSVHREAATANLVPNNRFNR